MFHFSGFGLVFVSLKEMILLVSNSTPKTTNYRGYLCYSLIVLFFQLPVWETKILPGKKFIRTEGTFVCACVKRGMRGVHKSRDFCGIFKSNRGNWENLRSK